MGGGAGSPFDWRTTATDLFERCRDEVIGQLERDGHTTNQQIIDQAFVDALMDIAKKVQTFDPSQGTMAGLLIGAARRELSNLIRGERRRRTREEKSQLKLVANEPSVERDPGEQAADNETAEMNRALTDQAVAAAAKSDEEREFLRLRRAGVEDLAKLARVLNVELLPETEQKAAVKKMNDRLNRRLARWGARQTGEGS